MGDVGIQEELDLKGINHIGGPADKDQVVDLKPGYALPHDHDVSKACCLHQSLKIFLSCRSRAVLHLFMRHSIRVLVEFQMCKTHTAHSRLISRLSQGISSTLFLNFCPKIHISVPDEARKMEQCSRLQIFFTA